MLCWEEERNGWDNGMRINLIKHGVCDANGLWWK